MSYEAAMRLRTYVETRGHTPVRVTKHLVRYWWKILNDVVFDGVLLPVRHIDLMVSQEVHAWAIPSVHDQIDLHIQDRFLERTTFLTVLVHEMVHAWEYMTRGRMSHGPAFVGWSKVIKERTPLILRKAIRDYEHTRRTIR